MQYGGTQSKSFKNYLENTRNFLESIRKGGLPHVHHGELAREDDLPHLPFYLPTQLFSSCNCQWWMNPKGIKYIEAQFCILPNQSGSTKKSWGVRHWRNNFDSTKITTMLIKKRRKIVWAFWIKKQGFFLALKTFHLLCSCLTCLRLPGLSNLVQLRKALQCNREFN